MKPYFSIIVPVYNVAPYLEACLNSVLAQQYTDWECICVDDGSVDGSGAILFQYMKQDCRIKVIYQSNEGVGCARNRALDKVGKDRWVLFLDSDDCYGKLLSSILSQYIHSNCKFYLFNYAEVEEVVDYAQKTDLIKEGVIYLRGTGFSSRLLWKPFYCGCYSIEVIRANNIRFPQLKRGEDRVFFYDYVSKIEKICSFDSYVGYFYRQREGSEMASVPSTSAVYDTLSHYVIITKMLGEVPSWAGVGFRVSFALTLAKWRKRTLGGTVQWKQFGCNRLLLCAWAMMRSAFVISKVFGCYCMFVFVVRWVKGYAKRLL